MEAPFIFGKIATDKNFTDREKETAALVESFTSLVNTIIISPRRWGKSSLVKKAADVAVKRDGKLRVCHLDLFNVRDAEGFYRQLAQALIRATSSQLEEFVANAKKFLSDMVPKIIIETGQDNEVSVGFEWNGTEKYSESMLDLAEKIAEEKGLKIVVCIDEFQNISEFADTDSFQKKLRAHWQWHKRVSYCLYGSKRHMMMEVFASPSKPFYKFGNLIFLNKIDSEHLISFFSERFSSTGKTITPKAALLIADLVDNHPYYAQQLAQLSWFRTEGECTEDTVRQAHQTLIDQLSLLFVSMTDKLSNQQVRFLHALVSGETAISSTETMHKYGISSATSIARSKSALIRDDILDVIAGKLCFQDPIYACWLKTVFFK